MLLPIKPICDRRPRRDGTSAISIQYCYSSERRTLLFTGLAVPPRYWDGSPWVYDYLGYLVPQIPNGLKQITAIVGSVTRAMPHPDGLGGTSPAGVVASFYAVRQ